MKMGLDSPSDQPNAKRVKADPASGYYSSANYSLTVAHYNCHSGFLRALRRFPDSLSGCVQATGGNLSIQDYL